MKQEGRFKITELLNEYSREKSNEIKAEEQDNLSNRKKLQKEEVMMLDVYDLEPSKENFYLVDDSLKQSIELVGILQPLLVNKPENGKYKVIAGHRRRLAVLALVEEGNEKRRYVPCVFKKEDVRDRLAIIMANRFRDKTDWERMMEAVEAEGLAKEIKKDYKLGGRTREVLAEITGLSEAQLGRYKAIFNNLDKGLMEEFRLNRIGFSVAAELCGLSQEWQCSARKLLEQNGTISLQDIKELKRQKESGEQKLDKSVAEPDGESWQTEPGVNKGTSGNGIGREIIQTPGEKLPQSPEKIFNNGKLERQDISISSMLYEEIISGRLGFLLLKRNGYTKGQEICLSECIDGGKPGRRLVTRVLYVWESGQGLKEGYCIIGFVVDRKEAYESGHGYKAIF